MRLEFSMENHCVCDLICVTLLSLALDICLWLPPPPWRGVDPTPLLPSGARAIMADARPPLCCCQHRPAPPHPHSNADRETAPTCGPNFCRPSTRRASPKEQQESSCDVTAPCSCSNLPHSIQLRFASGASPSLFVPSTQCSPQRRSHSRIPTVAS